MATPAEVVAVVEAITPGIGRRCCWRHGAGLRRGEVIGLKRPDVDLDAGTVWVRWNRVELLESPEAFDAEPKTDAGKRPVSVPPHVLP